MVKIPRPVPLQSIELDDVVLALNQTGHNDSIETAISIFEEVTDEVQNIIADEFTTQVQDVVDLIMQSKED